MKEKILIAVDCGKYQTKGIARYKGNTYMANFRTKMQQVKRLGVDIQPNVSASFGLPLKRVYTFKNFV